LAAADLVMRGSKAKPLSHPSTAANSDGRHTQSILCADPSGTRGGAAFPKGKRRAPSLLNAAR